MEQKMLPALIPEKTIDIRLVSQYSFGPLPELVLLGVMLGYEEYITLYSQMYYQMVDYEKFIKGEDKSE